MLRMCRHSAERRRQVSILEFILGIVILVGAYRLGLSDGRLDERTDQSFEKMDKLIAQVRPKKTRR